MPIVTTHQQALAEERAVEAQPSDAPDGDPARGTTEVPATNGDAPEDALLAGSDEDLPDFEPIPMAEETGDPEDFQRNHGTPTR